MNQEDRDKFEGMGKDIAFIKDTLVIALENHLKHIERYAEETRDMTEQAYGMAEAAQEAAEKTLKAAEKTESFVRWVLPLGIGFLALLVGVIRCLV